MLYDMFYHQSLPNITDTSDELSEAFSARDLGSDYTKGKVKLGAFVPAYRGLGAHIRRFGP